MQSSRPASAALRSGFMSKAFTREGDAGGADVAAARSRAHAGPITPMGARLARERLAELSARLGRASGPEERAVLEVERERVAVVASAPVGSPAAHGGHRGVRRAGERPRPGRARERVVVVASVDENRPRPSRRERDVADRAGAPGRARRRRRRVQRPARPRGAHGRRCSLSVLRRSARAAVSSPP